MHAVADFRCCGDGIQCLETTLGGNRGENQPRYPWCCNHDPPGEAGRHGVEDRQARKSRGLPPSAALSVNVFQICSALEFLSPTWMGGVDWTVGCYSLY
jgi:hypothetical protein